MEPHGPARRRMCYNDVLLRSPVVGCVRVQAQRRIAGLELQTTIETPELQKLGLQLELDKETGKMKVCNAVRVGKA